jgi:signal transduction histidine kinase
MTRLPAVTTRSVVEIAAFAAIYVVAARAGLGLDAVSGFATLVWAPSGLSLAAVLILGRRVWPGVFLGALAANILTGAPLGVALGLAAGNTIEALVGASLLRRVPGFRNSLDRVVDVIALIVFAALLSTTLSATIGVACLAAGGLITAGAGAAVATWRAWWFGDLIGDLLVAPVLLVWLTPPHALPRGKRVIEAAGVGVTTVIAAGFVFGATPSGHGAAFTQAYLFFPVLIWAALRFGQRGAVSAGFLVSTIAVWGTAMGRGPFVRPALHESLFALQTFMGIAAITFLALGAASSERRRAIAELERAVADARVARDLAAAANQAKGEFLAVMSHELRTPLNAIYGFTELLSLGVRGPITDEQRETLDRIRSNQAHVLGLVNDVLNFARIEAGHLTFDIQTIRVRDTFSEVEVAIEPDARKKAITMRRDLADATLVARSDPDKLRQVLINVVANAVKFTPSGGTVTMSARRNGDVVHIDVSDTGIGIPEEHLANVFEPFFQVENGKTRRHGGVGLGLAIARDLARAMGGEMLVESRLGSGTTVSIIIPAAERRSGVIVRPAAEVQAGGDR